MAPGIATKKIYLGSLAWMLFMTVVVFIPNISPWIATPVVLVGTILVLGLLWAVNLGIKFDKFSEYILYSTGLGLSFIILGGLVVNWILPYIGIVHPLAKLPLIIFFDSTALILAARGYYFEGKEMGYKLLPKLQIPDKTSFFFGVIPLLFIILSVCGAERLNNGSSGALTLIMLFAIALYVLVLLCWCRSVQGWVYISALYCIGLSLLLMYSLRSSHILGWDINLEYQVFQATLQNLRWKMSYYPGLDYNACLSITILPTIFKVLTNMPSEYVFKVTFQLLFAGLPVMIYVLAKRYLKESLAFLAAFLFVSQTWFFEQMPALIRQETAFLFFALLLLVLFDKKITQRARYLLFYLFTAGLIVSHYSTAYVWLVLLLIVLLLSCVARFFISAFRNQPMAIKSLMFVLSLILVFVWQIPLTHTAGGVTKFVTNANQGVAAVPPSASSVIKKIAAPIAVVIPAVAPPSDIISVAKNAVLTTFFMSNNQNSNQNILLAQQSAIYLYTGRPGYDIYPDAVAANYVPVVINEMSNVRQQLPQFLTLLINFWARVCKILFIDIFPIIGIVGMYFAARRHPSEGDSNFILFGIGAFGLVMLTILVPYVQEYYNLTRLYLQMFMILSTFAVFGGVMVVKYFPRYQWFALALGSIIIFCSLAPKYLNLND